MLAKFTTNTVIDPTAAVQDHYAQVMVHPVDAKTPNELFATVDLFHSREPHVLVFDDKFAATNSHADLIAVAKREVALYL